jgi:hypothetical protein
MKKILSILVAGLFLFGYSAFAQNLDLTEFKGLGDEQITYKNKAEAIKKLEQIEARDKVVLDDFMKKDGKKYIVSDSSNPETALKIYNSFKGAMLKSVDLYNQQKGISVKIYQIVIPQ